MQMETSYRLTATTEQEARQIAAYWDDLSETANGCSFEDYGTDVFDVMAKVIKAIHKMEKADNKLSFSIVGKCQSDYDCVVFSIDYSGSEPLIKASQGDPDFNEARYYSFLSAEYEEIPQLLKRNKGRTFKKAIKDDLPLGGFLDCTYEEWIEKTLDS